MEAEYQWVTEFEYQWETEVLSQHMTHLSLSLVPQSHNRRQFLPTSANLSPTRELPYSVGEQQVVVLKIFNVPGNSGLSRMALMQ